MRSTSSLFAQPSSNLTPPLLALLDFDGTLTGISGSGLVYSPYFESLSPKDSLNQCYQTRVLSDDVVERIQAEKRDLKFGEISKLASTLPGVLDFIRDGLKRNAQFHIITLNNKAYVRAELEASGLSKEELRQITFHNPGIDGKGNVVTSILNGLKGPLSEVIIADDTKGDFTEMKNAFTSHVLSQGIQKSYIENLPVGTYDWMEITKQFFVAPQPGMK